MFHRFGFRALVAVLCLLISLLALLRRRRGARKGIRANPQKPPKQPKAPKSAVFAEACRAVGVELAADAAALLYPVHFERHGHIVVAQTNKGVAVEAFAAVAQAFASTLKPAVDTVIVDTQGIDGELRRPIHVVAWQDAAAATSAAEDLMRPIRQRAPSFQYVPSPTFTTHIENKIRYSFDVMRVMFSSGNTEIRMHFGELDVAGEVVVDMFAGIGYFTIPLAVHGRPQVIHALEKNPDSVQFLRMNAIQNKVADRVRVYEGDNREVTGAALDGACDRVLMGYIPSCEAFLPRALGFLRRDPQGRPRGTVHYHFLADKPNAQQVAERDIRTAATPDMIFTVSKLHLVKSYAPKRFHYVADVVFAAD